MKDKNKKVAYLAPGLIIIIILGVKFTNNSDYLIYLIYLFPLALLFALLRNIVKGKQSMRWRHTKGKVVRSEVVTSGKGRNRYFNVVVEYEYKVFHTDYTNDTISFKPGMKAESGHRKMLQKYPVGNEVDVYYNPGDPKQAVLERGTNIFSNLIIFGFFLFSCILIYLFWKEGAFPV